MIKMVEQIVGRYCEELTDEEAFYLWDRWKRMVRYNCVPEWEEGVWPFVEFAVSRGFKLGDRVNRKDSAAPYGPENCFFDNGKPDDYVPSKEEPKGEAWWMSARAAEWNRCVYEPNKERVAEYRKQHKEESSKPQREGSCTWCYNEFCVYDQSPACTDYCPTENYPGLCRFDSRELI